MSTRRRHLLLAAVAVLLPTALWSLRATAAQAVATGSPVDLVAVLAAVVAVAGSAVGGVVIAIRTLGQSIRALLAQMQEVVGHLRQLVTAMDTRLDAHEQRHADEAVARAEWSAEVRHRLGATEDAIADHARRIGALERGPGEQTRRAG